MQEDRFHINWDRICKTEGGDSPLSFHLEVEICNESSSNRLIVDFDQNVGESSH